MSERVCANCGGVVDSVSGVCEACATQALSADLPRREAPAEAFPEISGYRLISHLGEGGMGSVYLAEETALGRRVAIKIVSQRIIDDARSKSRFAREARTLATIEHPNVVRVYSYGEAAGHPYLAMEFVEGETLGDRLQRSGVLGTDESLRIVRQIVEALEAAWEQRVVHRDIKPSNVLMDRRGRVRVADFGLAKPIEVAGSASPEYSLTEAGLVVGTPHYLPPEQAQGLPSDHRSDIYSVGLLLYQMLTGERPFDASSPFEIIAKQLREPLPSLSEKRPNLPAGVAALVEAMTHKDPAHRPQTHREILDAIDSLIGTTPASDTKAIRFHSADGHRLIGWGSSFAIVAATIAVVWAISWFVMNRQRPSRSAAPAKPRASFVVAVAPFYGPDEDSVKEGRVMAALVERAIGDRLGASAQVVGIEETKDPVRSDEQARALGNRLGASAVIWGEAFTLREETEIEPHVTVITRAEDAAKAQAGETAAAQQSPEDALRGAGTPAVKLQASAPNQIELRKMSASGIGDLVVLLAAIHQLEREKHPDRALKLLRELPRNAQTMRYEVRALIEQGETAAARTLLEEIVAADPSDVASLAILGDLCATEGLFDKAAAAFRAAAATGKAFSTTRAILFEDQLYVKETYRRFHDEERDTGSLIVVDPATGVVRNRFALPGNALGFRIVDGALEVSYDPFRSPPAKTLRFRNGRAEGRVFLPVNYMWRLGLVRSGSLIPANFVNEVTGIRNYGGPPERFGLYGERHEGYPETLSDLEKALREAARQDPTQPWHLLWLAVTLDQMGRRAEADAIVQDIGRREFPGVPYYVYNWMANQFERLQKREWADVMWEKVRVGRSKLPQPITFTTLLERLLNASPRQAGLNREPERGYEVLLRSREVTGETFEGEDAAATLWARYFDAKGDAIRAGHERDVARRVLASPLSLTNFGARVKYWVAAVLSVALALLLETVILLSLAVARARRLPRAPRRTSWRQHAAWAVSLLTLAGGLVLLGASYLLFVAGTFVPLVVLGLSVAIFATLLVTRISTRAILASVPAAGRRLLVLGYVLLLGVTLWGAFLGRDIAAISAMPLGLADAQGHPWLISESEKLIGVRSNGQTRYFAALMNHWGGEWKRAEELYLSTPAHAGARENLAAVRAHKVPAVMLTEEDLFAAYRPQVSLELYRKLDMPRILREFIGRPPATPAAIAVYVAPYALPLLLLILLLFVGPTRAEENERPGGRTWAAAAIFVPGLAFAARGEQTRAFAAALAFAIVLVSLVLMPSLGGNAENLDWFGRAVPSFFATAFPLPNGLHLSFGDRVALILGPSGAMLWWSLVLISIVLLVALHGTAVARAVRDWRARKVLAAPIAAPV